MITNLLEYWNTYFPFKGNNSGISVVCTYCFVVGTSPLRRGPSWQRIPKRDLSPFRPHPSPRVHDGRDRTLLRSSRQIPPQVCRRRERRGRSLLGLRSDGRKAGEKSCNWQGCSRGKGSCINDVTLS